MTGLVPFYRNHLRIVHPVRVVFGLVPKAANTSLRHAIHYACPLGRNFKETNEACRIQNAGGVVPHEYLRIIMVRNPWNRFRSAFTDKIARGSRKSRKVDHEFTNIGCYAGMPFEEFVERVCAVSDAQLEKHVMPQHYLWRNPLWRGEPDLTLRMECEQDWYILREIFSDRGFTLPVSLPRANRSLVSPPAWTPRTIKMIGDRYAEDIAMFSYLGYSGPC